MTVRPKAARAPRPLERDIQTAVIAFVKRCVRGGWCFHIPNATGGSFKNQRNHLFRRKADGVVSGVPDLCVMWPGGIAWLELKRPGEHPSEQQEHVHGLFRSFGQRVYVVRSVEDAEAALIEAGAPVTVSETMRGVLAGRAA